MILRSFLFVPADSERKLQKAKTSMADALILDLEDAVAADRRVAARGLAQEYLTSEGKGPASFWVRSIRSAATDYEEDLDAVVAARPAGLVVPEAGFARHAACAGSRHLRTRGQARPAGAQYPADAGRQRNPAGRHHADGLPQPAAASGGADLGCGVSLGRAGGGVEPRQIRRLCLHLQMVRSWR